MEKTKEMEFKKRTELTEFKEIGKTYKYDVVVQGKNGKNKYDDTFDT